MQHARRVVAASVLSVAAALCISTGTASAATPVHQSGLVMAQGTTGSTGGTSTPASGGVGGLLTGLEGLLSGVLGLLGL